MTQQTNQNNDILNRIDEVTLEELPQSIQDAVANFFSVLEKVKQWSFDPLLARPTIDARIQVYKAIKQAIPELWEDAERTARLAKRLLHEED